MGVGEHVRCWLLRLSVCRSITIPFFSISLFSPISHDYPTLAFSFVPWFFLVFFPSYSEAFKHIMGY